MATSHRPPAAAQPVQGWFDGIEVSESAVQSLVDALQTMNVCISHRQASRSDGWARNGVIAFGDCRPQAVVEAIRAAVSQRFGRVLALSMTGESLGSDCWTLLSAGASDVFSLNDVDRSLRHIAERLRRWQTIDDLLASEQVQGFLVGPSAVWQSTLREAVEVARFTDAPVLVTGESGTGKERIAQLIHQLDPRPNKRDFVVLDCSTVVPALSGSEFFGHEKGAFTGAATARAGAFELADGGTLFLDEVGELPVTLQAELLRVVQEGTFKRVGSSTWRKSRFRLVCATNRNLSVEQNKGTFRNDFYYRIAGCSLHLPALRQRTEDILPMFRYLFSQLHPTGEPPQLEQVVEDLLIRRPYPGNVRDLRNLVLRIAHRHLGDGMVTVGDLPAQERLSVPGSLSWSDDAFECSVDRALDQGARMGDITRRAADAAMRHGLQRCGGDSHHAAKMLGVSDKTVEQWQARRESSSRRSESTSGAGASWPG